MHDYFPRLDDLVGIGGAQRHQPGNRAQRYQLLDRLVGRSVFADADGIVGEDPDRGNFHEGREADRHLHVVAEDQEGRAVGADFRQHHAVDDRAHRVLANAKVEVARVVMARFKIARAVEGEPRLRRGIQIGRAAHEPGIVLGDGVENFAGRIAGRESLGIGRKRGQFLVPSVGRLPALHASVLSR